jgi:hypothetical protein
MVSLLMGERETLNKSCQQRAYAQRIVTTRLLYHLHDPAELISRMQRIYPRALSNCHTSARTLGLSPRINRQPARIQGQRPIRILVRRTGRNRHFLAWILT